MAACALLLALPAAAGAATAPKSRAAVLADTQARAQIDAPDLAVRTVTGAPVRPNPRPAGAAAPVLAVDEGFDRVDLLTSDGRFGVPGGIFEDGWIRQNNSDSPGNAWLSKGVGDPVDGSAKAFIYSNPFATLTDEGTVSSWLLTPPVNFSATTKLSFYTRKYAYWSVPTRMQVRVCAAADCGDVGTAPEDVGGFHDVVLDINPDETDGVYPEEWTRYELTAANGLPTSGSGRLAFRHYVHQDDGVLRGDTIALDRVVVEEGEDATSPLQFDVTVGPVDGSNPAACGTATEIEVAVGDQVNLCYRITNGSDQPLRHHWLRDNETGTILSARGVQVRPGSSYQYNRIVTVGQSGAPSATWMASKDPPGYLVDDSQPAQFVDLDGATAMDTQSYAYSSELPFPADFDFRLYRERIDTLCVGYTWAAIENKKSEFCGLLPHYGVRALPDSQVTIYGSALALYVAPLVSPLTPPSGIVYKTVGEAPNRRFVIAYDRVPTAYGSTDPARELSAQVVLNEGSGVIEFQYADVSFGITKTCDYGGCASIGMQHHMIGQPYSYLEQSLRLVDRIAWIPSDPTVHTRTRQVRITARAPALQLDTESIDASAAAGETVTRTIAIGNGGDGRLDWYLSTSAADSHMPPGPRRVLPLHEHDPGRFATRLPDPAALAGMPAPSPSPAPLALPAGNGSGDERPLWYFDIYGGYLVNTNLDDSLSSIRGYPAGRTITGADFIDDNFNQLLALDGWTGELLAYAPIGSGFASELVLGALDMSYDETLSGLKQDPTTGVIYLASSNGQGSRLWRVDPATLTKTLVGPIDTAPGILSMDFDDDGRLYGLDAVLDALFAIDKTSGAATPIGSLGISTGGMIPSLAFDPGSRTWYLGAIVSGNFGQLYTVDPLTGQATYLSTLSIGGLGAQIGAMALAHPGNRCISWDEVPWVSPSGWGGTIEPGATATDLQLSFDATVAGPGTHAFDLCVFSNDPARPRTAVPIRFTVAPGDAIFADGFDAPSP
ncbi:choice-of-anchor J domain-containing protein [Dokdonella ginsengisoli]|uniref:Choice-of-anchor J domain-containing protein n=1 Tax=Dokdonella ginsengisoli TaxID=363846 RepID=A0ABV9QT11_9GAMM